MPAASVHVKFLGSLLTSVQAWMQIQGFSKGGAKEESGTHLDGGGKAEKHDASCSHAGGNAFSANCQMPWEMQSRIEKLQAHGPCGWIGSGSLCPAWTPSVP